MTVQAIIFDFGGVLTTSPFEAFAVYESSHSLPPGFLRRVNATAPDSNAWARFERAEIDAATFDQAFLAESTALGHPVRGAEVLPLLAGDLRPRMVAALQACKARFKVGCITNNVPADGRNGGPAAAASGHVNARPEHARAVRGVMAFFDHVIESSLAGVRKPDPRIYAMMCAALAVDPAACVYLDDLGINCKPAAAMGMIAIKVSSEEQALADLAAATGLDI